MAVGSKHLFSQTYTAASSMSAASAQFCIVKLLPGDKVCPVDSNTDVPLGVLQNNPGLGEMAVVAISGFSKVRVGATDLTNGARIAADSTARAIAVVAGTSTGFYPVGRLILDVDGADNDGGLVSATINCLNPARNL